MVEFPCDLRLLRNSLFCWIDWYYISSFTCSYNSISQWCIIWTPIFDTMHVFLPVYIPWLQVNLFYSNLQEHDIGEPVKDRTCSQHSIPWQAIRPWSSRGGFSRAIVNSLFMLSLHFSCLPIWVFCIVERGGHGQEATSAQQIMERRSLWLWYRGSWQPEKWEQRRNCQLADEGWPFYHCTTYISWLIKLLRVVDTVTSHAHSLLMLWKSQFVNSYYFRVFLKQY
jgi:hypothetical protein